MKRLKICGLALVLATASQWSAAELLQRGELEHGELLPGYTSLIDSPFNGVASYANGDGVNYSYPYVLESGQYRLDVRGASSDSSAAGISVYLGQQKVAALSFNDTAASVASAEFDLAAAASPNAISFVLESDDGSNDTYLDWFELHRLGEVPPLPAAPVLPSQGVYHSGEYRNMFVEAGYSAAEVQAKVEAAYDQLFHSSDQQNQAIFIPVGDDMAYIWDVGNNDVRSEGMSYGMMMALQMDRKADFDKLWKWAHTYSLNKTGDMKGFFAWQVSTSGQVMDNGPAPDGEEYFVTALFFASHRWGDGEGIFNYSAQANQILKDMYGNGQTRYNNQGQLEEFTLINKQSQQIVFSPKTPSDSAWTDPSYHLPAFYELWARWADNNNSFWADMADVSREFFKTTAHTNTGLSPDYANFDGSPHGEFQAWKTTFQYDAWRTIGNAAMDYYWWQADPWQVDWVNRLQSFFVSQGIDSYANLYELDGRVYQNNSDHSPGLVAMNAMASLAADQQQAWQFVDALWNTAVPSGKWRYYDGCLYMFGMLALSGNYRIYCPAGECDSTTPPDPCADGSCGSNNQSPVARDDQAEVQQGESVSIAVLANDSDPDNDVLSIVSFSQGAFGSVTQAGDQLVYQAGADYSGQDSFSYTITDGELSASATVSITVLGEQPPVGDSSCSYNLVNSWQDGFQASISITNNGSSTLSAWEVSWSYSDGSVIDGLWNANLSGSNPYTASNLSWNGNIAPGNRVEFGFNGTGPGQAVQLTGSVCQ